MHENESNNINGGKVEGWPQVTRGDIAWIHKGDSESTGHEMWSDRPAVIMSNDVINSRAGCVMVVYLTTSDRRRPSPMQVPVTSSSKPSLAICNQVHTVDISRVGEVIGHATDKEVRDISRGLIGALQIGDEHFSTLFHKWENYAKDLRTEDGAVSDQSEGDSARLRAELRLTQAERDLYRNFARAQMESLDQPDAA